jgi:hypothetical protein
MEERFFICSEVFMTTTSDITFDYYIEQLEQLRSQELAWLEEEVQLESLVHDARVHGTIDDQRELRQRLHDLRIAREAHVRYQVDLLRSNLEL